MTEIKKEEEVKQVEESLESLDKKLDKVGRSSSRKIKHLKEYEPYIAAAIAFIFIASGMFAGNLLDNPSEPVGFVVVDLTSAACTEEWFCTEWTECSPEKVQERECLDFNACRTKNYKPDETKSCAGEHVLASVSPLTSAAVYVPQRDVKLGGLGIAVHIISWLSLLLVIAYIAVFYLKKKPLDSSWLIFAYWLAMIGVPLAIYYAVTRNSHLVGAYAALSASAIALVVLLVLKPWAGPGLAELKNVNKLLKESSSRAERNFKRIRHSRGERAKVYPAFMDKVMKRRQERELMLQGVREGGLQRINMSVRSMNRSKETKHALEQVESAVKEREERFGEMNAMLEKWAERRRKERAMVKKFKEFEAPKKSKEPKVKNE